MFIKQKSLIIESPWSRVTMQGSTPRVVRSLALVKSNLICPSDKLSWQPGCPVLNINTQGNFCISQGNGSSDNLLKKVSVDPCDVFSLFLLPLCPLPPQQLLPVSSKPFLLNLRYLGQKIMHLRKCTGWPFCDLDPRSQLWHWWREICLSTR